MLKYEHMNDKLTVGVVSLGCDKNTVDTEKILSKIQNANIEIVNEPKDAKVIIINTCAFINDAKVESIDTIFDMAEYKSKKCEKLIVIGCLAQRYYEDLKKDFKEIDVVLKFEEYDTILAHILENYAITQNSKRVLTTPSHYGYLKISDGCNNKCTYCAIPSIRGRFKSETIENLVKEAKFLIENYGIRELILVAQDVTNYGEDIYGKPSLVKLLDELEKLDVDWIRLLYCYPDLITDELITKVSKSDKIVKYFDIPLQHISNRILKMMNRKVTKEEIINLLDRIRNIDENISIRSTFIVGFPGESEEDFNEIKEFLSYAKFNNCGFFAYSKEEGTPAEKLPNQIDEDVKQERLDILYAVQTQIVEEINEKMINRTFSVLYEGVDYDNKCYYGRSYMSAPDIDNLVLFTGDIPPMVGEFVKVKINDTNKLDLVGKITD